MSSGALTVVSSSSRTTARPTPRRRPSTIASPRLRTGFGETGVVGRLAESTIVALIGARLLPGAVSSSLTNWVSSTAVACAILWASAGRRTVTRISRLLVCGVTSAVTFAASSSAPRSRLSSSMTARARVSPVIRSAYDATRCAVKLPLWMASVSEVVETNIFGGRLIHRSRGEGVDRGGGHDDEADRDDHQPSASQDTQVVPQFHGAPFVRCSTHPEVATSASRLGRTLSG